jgi:tetratricopeptide (TPR) repeat protein
MFRASISFLILTVVSIISGKCFAQNSPLDSLRSALQNAKHDTTRLTIRFTLGETTQNPRITFWDSLKTDCESLAKKDPIKANTSIKPEQKIYYALMAGAIGNIAYLVGRTGDLGQSLLLNEKALRIREQISDKLGIANSLHNIASIYERHGQEDKALEYSKRSLEVTREINDKYGQGAAYSSIGHLYLVSGQMDKALENFENALKLRQETKDMPGLADTYYCLGSLYFKKNDQKKAFDYFNAAVKINETLGDEGTLAASLNHVAKMYLLQKNYPKAFEYLNKSMAISKKLGFPELLRNVSGILSKTYKAGGDSKHALEYFEMYIKYRDSIENMANKKAVIKNQLKYEYEKQAAADSVAHAKESEIKNVELKRQEAEIKAKKNQQYALFGGLGLVIIFAGFMYNRFKVTQKQKEIIENQKEIVEEQKQLVEEKQKEILDSIHYAKRIQLAQIPSEKMIAKNLERLRH